MNMNNQRLATFVRNPSAGTLTKFAEELTVYDLALDGLWLVGDRPTLTRLLLNTIEGNTEPILRSLDDQGKDRPVAFSDGAPELGDNFGHAGIDNGVDLPVNEPIQTGEMHQSNRSTAEIARSEQNRRRLKQAFTHHLNRPLKGEDARVSVRVATATPTGQYCYLDNRPAGGGAHYFNSLTSRMQAEVVSLALVEGLTILIEGRDYVSLSFEAKAVENDVAFLETVVDHVFDASLADINSIEEVIDTETSREWVS